MSKTNSKNRNEHPNPFLSGRADELRDRLDKGGKPISKEELIKRAKALKEKKNS
jgi:hypothetical protein